ncbi:MAG: TonB-dependent receptor [Pseudomonadota bacterium]
MFKPSKIATAVAFATGLSAAGQVSAQVLEEVMVTASKRTQSMQDVGISVSAFTGDQMRALGVTNTVEITQQIPNLQVLTFSPNLTFFNIRGVSQNNFTDNLEAPVAVYIDDVYMATMNGVNAQLFDVERVEVLRGPQGTLFGRNATGGVIHYLTVGADEDELNGYIEGTVGDYDRQSIEFALGGGLTDGIRGRIAGRIAEMDGFIESEPFPEGNPLPPSGVDIGGEDGWTLRGELQFDFGDTAMLTLQASHTEDDAVTTGAYSFLPFADNSNAYIPPEFQQFTNDVILEGGAPPGGLTLEEFTAEVFFCQSQLDCFAPVDESGRTIFEGDSPEPHEHYSDYAGFMDRETDSYTAKFDWEVNDSMDFVSITNYFELDKFYTEDGDGIPVPIIEFTTVSDFTQFSQEIRLSGESNSFRWVAGLYYLDMETKADVITRGAPVSGVAVDLGFDPAELGDPQVAQEYTLDSSNWSVFGQGEWDFADDFTLILGLRWSEDDKEMDFVTSFQSLSNDINIPAFDLQSAASAAGSSNDEVDYSDWAGRLQLDWRFSDNAMAYASYNRGIKGGNFAPSANVGLDNIRHDEEVLHAYEIGVKSELADGKVRLNGAIFYYDYDDYQAFTFSDATPSIANADAQNIGGEIELTWTPTVNWDIIAGFAYMDSEVDGVQTPQQQVTPVGFEVDWPIDFLDGVELPNTPSYSVNYLVRYNFDALAGNIALQVDGVYYDDQFLEVSNAGGTSQEAYGVHNARLTWESQERAVRVAGWVKNLADEEYKIYSLDLGILGATVTYAPPRMYGLTASYHF